MFVPFAKLSPAARVWIYQSDRKITSEEKTVIANQLNIFTGQWQVHGAPLEASFDIRFDHFIILAANDTTSGCSIDSSVRAVKELGQLTGIDFFNRNLVAFKHREEIRLIALPLLKSAYTNGDWSEETPVFNNLVSSVGDLAENWVVPAASTWLKRYGTLATNVK